MLFLREPPDWSPPQENMFGYKVCTGQLFYTWLRAATGCDAEPEPGCRGGNAQYGCEKRGYEKHRDEKRPAVFTPLPSPPVCAGDRGESPAGASGVAIGEWAGSDGERPVAHVGRMVAGR